MPWHVPSRTSVASRCVPSRHSTTLYIKHRYETKAHMITACADGREGKGREGKGREGYKPRHPSELQLSDYSSGQEVTSWLAFSCSRWWSRSLRRRSSCLPGASWCRR